MRNLVRRSRNIGKTQGGRVKNGCAEEKWSRNSFLSDIYSQLSESNEKWQLFQQNPSRDYFHPCDAHEYLTVLKRMPNRLTKYVKAIILPRITKRDEKYGVEAKRRYDCIILNPFPVNMEMVWHETPIDATIRHYEPWCDRWQQKDSQWILKWEMTELKTYYLYHIFLHELGHLNQPWFHALRRREEFAENFALEWAKKLGRLRKLNKKNQPTRSEAARRLI